MTYTPPPERPRRQRHPAPQLQHATSSPHPARRSALPPPSAEPRYAGPQYAGRGRSPVPPPAPRNGLGTASLALGLLGSAVAFVPPICLLAWPIVIVGLALGTLGVLRVGAGVADNRGVAVGGIACSAAGLVVSVGWMLLAGISAKEPAPATTPTAGGALSTPATADSLVPPVAAEEASGHSIGAAVDVDGLVLTAGPLMRTTGPGGPLVCSMVAYQNDTGAQVGYNGLFDWKLQTPDGATANVQSSGGARRLGSGDLTPGSRVAGNVCFDDPGLTGDHVVIHDLLNPGPSTGTRWTAVL